MLPLLATIGLGTNVGSAVQNITSSQRAAASAAAAGEKLNKQQRKALQQFTQAIGQVQAPQWDVARDIKDAGQITDYNVGQLEKIFPGAKTQREIASRATESLLRGEIPRDVQEQIMRSVAELGGAGFQPTVMPTGVPAPSGFQAAQGLLSRQLGMTSLELQQMGQQSSQSWQRLAGAFIESPLQVGQARLGFEKAAADIQMRKAEGLFGAQTGVAQSQYGVAMENIGTRLAADQAIASGIRSIGSSAYGAMSGFQQAQQAQQLAQGTGAFASPNKQGFYQSELAASRAFNVSPQMLSKQEGEGFYYTPGGVYGRGDQSRSIVYGGG